MGFLHPKGWLYPNGRTHYRTASSHDTDLLSNSHGQIFAWVWVSPANTIVRSAPRRSGSTSRCNHHTLSLWSMGGWSHGAASPHVLSCQNALGGQLWNTVNMWMDDLMPPSNFWLCFTSCSPKTSSLSQDMAHLESHQLTLWCSTGPCCCAACWSSSCQQLQRCVVASPRSSCWCTGVSAPVSRWVGAGRGLLPPVWSRCMSGGEAHEGLWGRWGMAERFWQLGWSVKASKKEKKSWMKGDV